MLSWCVAIEAEVHYSLLHAKSIVSQPMWTDSSVISRWWWGPVIITHTNRSWFATLLYFPHWLNRCGKTQYGRSSLVIKSHSHSPHSLISVRRSEYALHAASGQTSKNAVQDRSCSQTRGGHFTRFDQKVLWTNGVQHGPMHAVGAISVTQFLMLTVSQNFVIAPCTSRQFLQQSEKKCT